MKKIFSIMIICLLIPLVGCFENEYDKNDGGITLSIAEDYKAYMHYENIPTFTFAYDGVLNTIANVDYNYYTSFCMNDDVVLSNHIASLLNEYKDDTLILVDETKQALNTKINVNVDGERVSKKIPLDESKKYYETAYIYLDNGLQLCVTYCRFVSEGVTYYRWRETKNIEMAIFYPLMVIKTNDVKEFVITPLPFQVATHVSGSSTVSADKVMADDGYIAYPDQDSTYYTYDYYDSDLGVEENKKIVTDYYVNYHEATIIDDYLYFTYLNVRFRVALFDNYFVIRFVEKEV